MPAIRSRRLRQAAAGLVTLAAAGYAAPPADAQVAAAPPPGTARFWFYRDFFANDTGDMPRIAMNGAMIGYGLSGTNFFRDVAAGQYHLTVESVGQDVGQSQDVTVAPGQLVYVKIASLPSWEEGGNRGAHRRGTYYVMIVPPQLAALEISTSTYSTRGN